MEEKVKTLIETYGQNDQRTAAWHAKRGSMLTASEIWKAMKDATPAARHELMMSKLTPRKEADGGGARALIWGTRFEPIAKEIYCKIEDGVEIVDTTCVPHPTVSFLGASPDGILVTEDVTDSRYGKLVEFKCPISRVFSDETPIPTTYYHQMQLQMECTGLKECDYIEMGFKDVNYTGWVDSTAEYKSFFAVHDDGSVKYKLIDDPRSVSEWRKEELGDDGEFWTMVYWYLNQYRIKKVVHDTNWLSDNMESFQSVWDEIVRHREAGTLPTNPKEKTVLTL